MRQVVLAGTDGAASLSMRHVPEPGAPGPGEVAVRIHAASLNFRDLLIAWGKYPLPAKPELVPLSDGAGTILAVGGGVSGLQVGQRVISCFFPDWHGGSITVERVMGALGGTLDGVLSDVVNLPASAVMPFAGHLDFTEAATLPCAGVTAWNALVDTSGVKAGDVVLVQGTGGVSSFALQFAKLFGATVIQISSSDAKLAKAKALGADHLVNYTDDPEWDQAARALTGGRGVDIVVEIGGAGTLEKSIRATRVGGTVATIGLVTGVGAIDPLPILSGVISVKGVLVGSHDMAAAMMRAIESSGLRPVVDRVMPFEQAADAYGVMERGEAQGKIVLSFD